MNHSQLFALIASIKNFKPAREHSRLGFDVLPDALVGYTDTQTVIFEGDDIIVLDTEGGEYTFNVSAPFTVGG